MIRAIPLFSVLVGFSTSVSYCGTLVPTYGTYFGGGGQDNAVAVTTDAQDNVIVVGTTTSQSLPGTLNAFQPTKAQGFANNQNVFVAKVSATGRNLIWSTFLGGDTSDSPSAVAVDSTGNIYVLGTTQSSNFPASSAIYCDFASATVAFQQACSTEFSTHATSGFLSKLSPDGHTLLYSLGFGDMLHGTLQATALAVDNQGAAFVSVVGAGLSGDLFLIHLDTTATLLYGTFLGAIAPSFVDTFNTLALDSHGNCYVAGASTINVPTTPNALQISNSNADLNPNLGNGYLMEIDPSGRQLLYGTLFGPRYSATTITSIRPSSNGSVYFSGATTATTFQTTTGAYQSMPGGGFIANLIPGSVALSALSYLPFDTSLGCGSESATPGGTECGTVAMAISEESQMAYVLSRFEGLGGASEVLDLKLPSVAGVGPTSYFGFPSGVIASNMAVSLPTSLWVVGGCTSCSLVISSDAYQPSPSGTGSAFLVQLTDISPSISLIASAATGASPFAAGQLVSIYGSQLGPAAGSGLQLGPDGVVTNANSGAQVLFDGTAAPILYTSAGQVNAAIPCSVAGKSSTQLVIQYMGAQSPPLTVALGPAAPGIFTADGSGKGQAAALNQDNSFNSLSNPAPRGSVVTFYATGVGATSPCVDGQVYQSNFPTLTLPVIVGVGSSGAQVKYSGQAPDLVSGVAQFNIVIPSDAPPGIVSLTLVVGGVFSPSGVTISVK
jgi:uncharacterized protein (TIGR03437 family)